MKTSELTGAALDWAVAQCMTGGEIFRSGRVAHQVALHSVGGTVAPYFVKDSGVIRSVFSPSTSWSQGGPIIERELIDIYHVERAGPAWEAEIQMAPCQRAKGKGATALIAAMRCYVASKLGDDVVIPEELR